MFHSLLSTFFTPARGQLTAALPGDATSVEPGARGRHAHALAYAATRRRAAVLARAESRGGRPRLLEGGRAGGPAPGGLDPHRDRLRAPALSGRGSSGLGGDLSIGGIARIAEEAGSTVPPRRSCVRSPAAPPPRFRPSSRCRASQGGVNLWSTVKSIISKNGRQKPLDVEEDDGLPVQVEPAPAHQLDHLLQRADAARKDGEGVGLLEHDPLAVMHGGDDHRVHFVVDRPRGGAGSPASRPAPRRPRRGPPWRRLPSSPMPPPP